jgi:hypothetical protein
MKWMERRVHRVFEHKVEASHSHSHSGSTRLLLRYGRWNELNMLEAMIGVSDVMRFDMRRANCLSSC